MPLREIADSISQYMTFRKGMMDRLARPYPHGFINPLLGKGQKARLASGLASGERRAREAGIDPKYWRGMLGVMNIWNKRNPSPLGADMDFKDMLNDMVGLYGGGRISMENALKAWRNP